MEFHFYQGPYVKCIVSLTRSLVEDFLSLTVLIKPNAVIFLEKNCEKLVHCKRYAHFLAKNDSIFTYITSENLMSH